MAVLIGKIVTVMVAALQNPRVIEAIAKAVSLALGKLATKEKEVVGALKADVADVKTDEANLRAELAAVKTDVGTSKIDMADLKTDVAGLKRDFKLLKFAYGPLILALLVKLAFFP